MKLRLSLLLFCLLGIGVFSHSQDREKTPPPPPPAKPGKPTLLNGPDAIPVIVKSNKKAHWKVPPPPPPPKVKADKFTPPKMIRDVEKAPAKPSVPIKPDAPPKYPKA